MSFQSLLEEKYVRIWADAKRIEQTIIGDTAWTYALHRLAGMHDILGSLDQSNVISVYEEEREDITFLVNLAFHIKML